MIRRGFRMLVLGRLWRAGGVERVLGRWLGPRGERLVRVAGGSLTTCLGTELFRLRGLRAPDRDLLWITVHVVLFSSSWVCYQVAGGRMDFLTASQHRVNRIALTSQKQRAPNRP